MSARSIAVALILLLTACTPTTEQPGIQPPPSRTAAVPPPSVSSARASSSPGRAPSPSVLPLAAGACHYARSVSNQPLPDPACTPGSVNPDVSAFTMASTICKPGWTATVRPPSSYTSTLKLAQMKAYDSPGEPEMYAEDHLIPLQLGGAPRDPNNLWPEPGAAPNAKDTVEGKLNDLVCSGQMSLSEAQKRIATDWTTALP